MKWYQAVALTAAIWAFWLVGPFAAEAVALGVKTLTQRTVLAVRRATRRKR